MIEITDWIMSFHIENHRWPNLREVAEKFPEIGPITKLAKSVQFPQEIVVKPTQGTPNENPNHRQ